MVNAREWLDRKYPKKREGFQKLLIDEPLEGMLDLTDFFIYKGKQPFHEFEVFIYPGFDESKFTITTQTIEITNNIKITKLVWVQEYLDDNYPQTEREKITKLDINYKKITGILDLTTFPQLEELLCNNNCLTNLIINENSSIKEIGLSYNNFTTLTITNQPLLTSLYCESNRNLVNLVVSDNTSLTRLDCHYCQLTNLQLTNNPQLSWLRCSGNNLTNLNTNNKLTGDLVVCQKMLSSQFTELAQLLLDNNPFTGSLIFLTNITKLKMLSIENTQFDSGLEYLPESLERIYCWGDKLKPKLKKDYLNKDKDYYDYQAWRKDHQELIKIGQLETMLTNLILSNVQEISEIFFQGFNVFIFEIQSEITELKNQNKEYYQAKIEVLPKD